MPEVPGCPSPSCFLWRAARASNSSSRVSGTSQGGLEGTTSGDRPPPSAAVLLVSGADQCRTLDQVGVPTLMHILVPVFLEPSTPPDPFSHILVRTLKLSCRKKPGLLSRESLIWQTCGFGDSLYGVSFSVIYAECACGLWGMPSPVARRGSFRLGGEQRLGRERALLTLSLPRDLSLESGFFSPAAVSAACEAAS